ncbi:MAG: hypothetical protein KF817_05665 [Phycisphaeraceae bacterium]|nr:hypothetical protein [Phycisphaeraceae bacterium]
MASAAANEAPDAPAPPPDTDPVGAASGSATSPGAPAAATPPLPDRQPPADPRLDRIARYIIDAAPPASARDARARDAAVHRLSRFGDLLDAIGDRITWGHSDVARSKDDAAHDPSAAIPTIGLAAEVWAGLYLTCFMFSDPHEVRQEGAFTVLLIPARFRAGLPDGDYPHPFWHDPAEWKAYVDATAVRLVFRDGRLVAGSFTVPADGPMEGRYPPSPPPADRTWHGQWTWTDARGASQPRVAQFDYLLDPTNPHARTLGHAYRELSAHLEQHDCLSCHRPSNPAAARVLELLGYPGQALGSRERIVEVLLASSMPPARPGVHEAGIADDAARDAMLRAARRFVSEGDAALAYEHMLTIRPDQPPRK